MKTQYSELDYALEVQNKYQELVQKLTSLNGQVSPEEKSTLYNAVRTYATELDACRVTELARLLKEKLGIPTTLFLRDLRKAEKGINLSGESKEKIKDGKEPLTAYFPNLVDIVAVKGKPVFLAIKDGELCWNETAELEGQIHLPPPAEHLPWLLPRLDQVLKYYKDLEAQENAWIQTLCDDLYTFLYGTSEMSSDDYYWELLIPWILHTYLLDHFNYSPILCLFAVPERGKSRLGKALAYLSYRGVVVESLRESNIIRMATDCRATIFFDCMGLWKKVERNQSEDVILGRYERGSIVPRVLWPERGPFKDTKNYTVFGPTILATNEAIHQILETRAMMINMPEANRDFIQDITPELALSLKERLTAFRTYYLEKTMPEVPKPTLGRLGDILKPLYQVVRLVHGEKGDPSFLDFVAKLEEDRRMERSDTLEAQVVRTILALEKEVERGILPVKLIADTINETRPEKRKLSYQRMGYLLNALGLAKGYIHGGSRGIIWDKDKIIRLSAKYGVQTSSPTPPTPPSSPESLFKGGGDGEDGEDGEDVSRGGNPKNEENLQGEMVF